MVSPRPRRPHPARQGGHHRRDTAIDDMDSELDIRNKLGRGEFTAVFFIQCLEAIGASFLRLSE
ncbi:DUF6471 domain-containing protein [Sphingomonas qilianensis]|uniref:DUF6471 domain-containing protein n=1 Tax=Sphingomonas qilianensis TaxID=1736690 RepID=UPI00363E5FFD